MKSVEETTEGRKHWQQAGEAKSAPSLDWERGTSYSGHFLQLQIVFLYHSNASVNSKHFAAISSPLVVMNVHPSREFPRAASGDERAVTKSWGAGDAGWGSIELLTCVAAGLRCGLWPADSVVCGLAALVVGGIRGGSSKGSFKRISPE
jgi:hypothetical protein